LDVTKFPAVPGSSSLILSLAGEKNEELITAITNADDRVRLVEIRLDGLSEEPALAAFRTACRRPLLATLRCEQEGGRRRFPDSERRRILLAALEAGFDFIDVEGFSGIASDPEIVLQRSRTILSFHDLTGVPGDLAERARTLARQAPVAVKVVGTAMRLGDCRRLFELLSSWQGPIPIAAFAMGEAGTASRVLAPYLGSALTYVSRSEAGETAPGQLSADRAIGCYGLEREFLRPAEKLFGVAARNPARSDSPLLHNSFFRRIGFPGLYLPLPVANWADEFADLFEVQSAGFLGSGIPLEGLSVTIPWKRDAWSSATSRSPEADETGAANTLVRNPAGFLADNTDLTGLVEVLSRIGIDQTAEAVVLGAGGSARAALAALRRFGGPVTLCGRSENARELASGAGVRFVRWEAGEDVPSAQLYVHATPMGASDEDPAPVPERRLGEGVAVVDLVYRRGGTRLVLSARKQGARAVDGHALLVAQGARQAARFLGRPVTSAEFLGDTPIGDPSLRDFFASPGVRGANA